DALDWWAERSASAVVRDDLQLPGSGLVAFGSFAFADQPGDSVLVVPRLLVGRRGDTTRLPSVGVSTPGTGTPAVGDPPAPPEDVSFAHGALSGADWERRVAEAVRRIGAGDLEKVVLARDLVAQSSAPLDVRWPLRRLAEEYPTCWTFHVAHLFGATPEML